MLTMACGGMAARAALKGPLADKCTEAGLKSCNRIAEGALLYVEGDTANGTADLKQGIADNGPEELRGYAKKLRMVLDLPGVGAYAGRLNEIVAMMEGAADEAPSKAPAGGSASRAAVAPRESEPRALRAERSVDDMRTATATPGADTNPRACPPALSTALGAGACNLTRQYIGPLVVTDLYTTGDCPDDLFVLSGQPEEPRWLMLSRASGPLALHNAQLVVPADEPLFVGARSRTGSPLQRDSRCSVTWSGWRPSR